MTRFGRSGLVVAVLLCSSCEPPPYDPQPGERFWSMLVAEQWTRDDAAPGTTTQKERTHSILAVATWRLGRDAPLPRAWRANEECLVLEGSWEDTPFMAPTHGELTGKFGDHDAQVLGHARTEWGYEWMDEAGWDTGDMVALSGVGGGLPAFHARSITPAEPTLTTWDMAKLKMGEPTIKRDAPLLLDWVPQAHDVLFLILQTRKTLSQPYSHLVWCIFPGRRGNGTVPLEVMRLLKPQAEIGFGNIYFASIVREQWAVENTDFEWANWNGRGARATWE